jgi:DNA ligase (NAD+)
MSDKSIKTKIEKLRLEIDKHRIAYHVHDKPTISDEVYDSLMKELIELEGKYPQFNDEFSPSKRVGGEVLREFQKVKHTVPQWSFDNVFGLAELLKWEERNINYLRKDKGIEAKLEYFCELKIDGVKVVLYYKDGKLDKALTRGDGEVGEDITANIKTLKTIPFSLGANIDLAVIGELWIGKKEFKKINLERVRNGLEEYKNPRNLSAGTVRQLDTKLVAQRKLNYFAYDSEFINDGIGNPKWVLDSVKSQKSEIEMLKKLGFMVNTESRFCENIDEIQKMHTFWNTERKDKQDYGIDGIVIKVDNKKLYDELGFTAKSPRGGVAYKFTAQEAVSKLLAVTYQVGRTGVVTPVAELNPIELSGSTVKRATLHNYEEIERLGVKIGDSVMVRKAGDIIPQVFGVLTELRTGSEKKIPSIKNCPVCKETLSKDTENSGIKIYCPNEYCEAKAINKVIYFAGRKCANIEGLGESTVNSLYEAGFVKRVSDLYKLSLEQILTLEGFKDKSAVNLLGAIEKARTLKLETFIMGLSIKNIGEETSGDLAKTFKSLDNFLALERSDLEKIHGLGERIIDDLVSYLADKDNRKEIALLLKFVKVLDYKNESKSARLDDMRFVITGTFTKYSREDIEKMIKTNGGSVQSTVNQKTSFLILGTDPGSKLSKATKFGIKNITLDQFLKML